MNIIAIVKLGIGRAGYFDPISRVHLTIKNSTATIYDTMNTTGLQKALKSGTINLVSGSLTPETVLILKQKEEKVEKVVENIEVLDMKMDVAVEPEIDNIEFPVTEIEAKEESSEMVEEEIIEEVQEEVVVKKEKPAKKKKQK